MFNYKLRFFALHCFISLVIVLISSAIVWFVWYPAPLYKATGVHNIFLILLAIGLLAGPLLTFLVSKSDKKSLKFDLSIIALLQWTAFFYGIYQVYDGRPAWIVYNVDRFDLVKNNDIDNRKLIEASVNYQTVSSSGAQYVAAIIPKDNPELNNEILFDEIGSGIAPSQRPELYAALYQVDKNIIDRAHDITELANYNDATTVNKILSAYPEVNGFLPLKATAIDMTVLIRKDQPEVIEMVDLRPW